MDVKIDDDVLLMMTQDKYINLFHALSFSDTCPMFKRQLDSLSGSTLGKRTDKKGHINY